ncbi:MAG: ankyrin repeat domain-containing protein [Alphaproteobacteria bacterium]|nr:ankyrin repeat domain-containing protein [Alphaproteobacteria bacterium]
MEEINAEYLNYCYEKHILAHKDEDDYYNLWPEDPVGTVFYTSYTEYRLHKELFKAAGNGDIETVKELIALDVNVSVNAYSAPFDEMHDSVLSLAISRGHIDMVKFLIDNGADVNGKGSSFLDTPVQAAVYLGKANGGMEILEILIKAGADLNIPDKLNTTPLDNAIIYRQFEIASQLRAAGAMTEQKLKEIAFLKKLSDEGRTI